MWSWLLGINWGERMGKEIYNWIPDIITDSLTQLSWKIQKIMKIYHVADS